MARKFNYSDKVPLFGGDLVRRQLPVDLIFFGFVFFLSDANEKYMSFRRRLRRMTEIGEVNLQNPSDVVSVLIIRRISINGKFALRVICDVLPVRE